MSITTWSRLEPDTQTGQPALDLLERGAREGWALAGVNCMLVCIIGFKTDQLGFIPANVFCMVMSAINLRTWRKSGVS